MANAKKLPSGSWSCLAYSHTETVSGKQKRIYERFTAPTKKEAEYQAAEFALNKKYRNAPHNMTVKQGIRSYIESKSNIISASTLKTYLSTLDQYYTLIGDIPLSKLTQEAVQQEINLLSASLSPKTVKNIHGLLSASLAVYLPNLRLRTSLPKKRMNESYIPTEADIKHLLSMTETSDFYTPILLAATLGLRRGEISGLKWSDVDFSKRTLSVRTSIVLSKDNIWVEKPPKSYAGNRVLDLPYFVAQHLLREKEGGHNVIYITEINPACISKRFQYLLKHSELPHFRFHDLRHPYVKLKLKNNSILFLVKCLNTLKSPRITEIRRLFNILTDKILNLPRNFNLIVWKDTYFIYQ